MYSSLVAMALSPPSRGRGLKYAEVGVDAVVYASPPSRGRGLKSVLAAPIAAMPRRPLHGGVD